MESSTLKHNSATLCKDHQPSQSLPISLYKEPPNTEMSNAPYKSFPVVLFRGEQTKHSEDSECEVFVASSVTQMLTRTNIWSTTKGLVELEKHYESLPQFENFSRRGCPQYGWAMIKPFVSASTCTGDQRPSELYRVVYEQQPHHGRKARGHGLITPNPLTFQILVQKHLDWRCRNPSPFISATNSKKKVRKMVKVHQARGRTGIQVIKFRTNGPGWDHSVQRLFDVRTLCHAFHRPFHAYNENEYLLESHIPLESIQTIRDMPPGEEVHCELKPRKRKLTEERPEGQKGRTLNTREFKREI
ncbi:hypothetical protein GGR55DRAFT_677900 [Xylaria sp. FL0064]|nr:hypothetical protein GGR55DRAFT_677900 [Xylaria sp. FL0064]